MPKGLKGAGLPLSETEYFQVHPIVMTGWDYTCSLAISSEKHPVWPRLSLPRDHSKEPGGSGGQVQALQESW